MGRIPEFHTLRGIECRLAEGRGLGHGSAYRPYFTRFDVKSHGERRETYSPLCDRGVHLLSRLEYHWFLLGQDLPDVRDVREQFPLPLDETEHIADELGIIHPRHWQTGCHVVMTTDLVWTRRAADGAEFTEAWSCKYSESLESSRTREKQLIEATWHRRQGHGWFLRTEEGIPTNYVSNLDWLQPLRRRDAMLGYPADLPAAVDEVMRGLMANRPDLLWRLADECDRHLGGSRPAASLYTCRYLLASGRWRADLRSWQRNEHPLRLVQ